MREAVVAASNKPDHAFKWLSKVWDQDTKIDDLRDTEGFPTLDAKVLSAVTNVLEGEFARQIDSFKEREAHAGRLVRGRQVLAKLDAYFATSALHGSLYEFEDLLGVKLVNENLITFMSNWDTVLSGMKVTPEDQFLEPLFHREVKKCKSISHDIAIYERATEGAKERSYAYLHQAASNYLARGRLDRNRERMARQLGDDKPALPAAKRVPKSFCISFVKNGSCRLTTASTSIRFLMVGKTAPRAVGEAAVLNQDEGRAAHPRPEGPGFANSISKAVAIVARTASSCTPANLALQRHPTQREVREEAPTKARRVAETSVVRNARNPDLAPRAQRGHATAKAPSAVRAQIKESDPRRRPPLPCAS